MSIKLRTGGVKAKIDGTLTPIDVLMGEGADAVKFIRETSEAGLSSLAAKESAALNAIEDKEKEALENIPNAELVNNLKIELSNLDLSKIDKPNTSDNNKFPRAKDGNVEWVEYGLPTDAQTSTAVQNWLNDHPEATTIQDGSLTKEKFEASLKSNVESIPIIKSSGIFVKDGVLYAGLPE